jgi:hypothetical protein
LGLGFRMQGGAGADQEFNAMRLVKNEETKRFWAHHFGPKVRFFLRLASPSCGFLFLHHVSPCPLSDFQGNMGPVPGSFRTRV